MVKEMRESLARLAKDEMESRLHAALKAVTIDLTLGRGCAVER